MASNAETNRELVAHLLQALEIPDQLTHEQAQAQLPALIQAQLADEDVESNPAYVALQRHLDRCDICIVVYEQLAEELEAAISSDQPLPSAQLTPPTFFKPVVKTGHVVLRVLKGIKSRFQIDLTLPRRQPELQFLSPEDQLFAGQIDDLPGAPFVAVAFTVERGTAELVVAVRRSNAATRWQVQLIHSGNVWTELTDAAGIARFGGLDVERLTEVQLNCSEIAGEGLAT